MSNQDHAATLGDILDRAREVTVEKVNPVPSYIQAERELPPPVQKFCGEIDKNFEITSEALDATAHRLETAAADLRLRAKELREAAPDVREHVERWIKYERESNERGKFLNSIF